MNENRAIQRSNHNVPAASIMTPTGPAIIQVIDMPAGGALGPVMPGGPTGATSPAIRIMGGILRRWWLVLIVTVVFGGSVYIGAQRFMSPVYEARATLIYQVNVVQNGPDPTSIIHSGVSLITSKEVTLRAARKDELKRALPWVATMDLRERARERDMVLRLKDVVEAEDDDRLGIITISTEKPDPNVAADVVNAYAEAFTEYVADTVAAIKSGEVKDLQNEAFKLQKEADGLRSELVKLKIDSNMETKIPEREGVMKLLTDLNNKQAENIIKQITAQTTLDKFRKTQNDPDRDPSKLAAAKQKQRLELLELERSKDQLLQSKMKEQIDADAALTAERTANKTDAHPDVVKAKQRLDRAIAAVEARDNEIRAIIEAKIAKVQELEDRANEEKLTSDIEETKKFLEYYKIEKAKLDKQLQDITIAQGEIDKKQVALNLAQKQYEDAYTQLQTRKKELRLGAPIKFQDPAYPPAKATEDKRQKVQLAGCGVGFLLGIILALLIDFFDKRLRHPKDIEPLLNTPVLGMIPRIQELKKVRGEQARNLIAEEFRVIRTQLLFGNPQLQNKTICVTSPSPGDGKTSLAVNLAISIAKAGRRTLLIDADMRKPDVHRIFNIPDSPGLAELIHGSCEPGAAIRKSDIELLDVLPAGTPLVRPSELVSRPEMAQLLAALGELYDHIVFDSAPLLPVSDTHVLAGMVDGVICSFNAEVDRGTVKMVEEILGRCRANLVGTVMNQVKYKQSNSYSRGKTAYDSYYSSPRGGGSHLARKHDPNVSSTGEEAA